MIETRQPTAKDIQELVAFLPKLYADGFEPITGYYGGVKDKDGIYIWPHPKYDKLVDDFIDLINEQDCWRVRDYLATTEKLDPYDPAIIANATMPEIQALMTFFLRGERLCDGFWDSMIKTGFVRQLLECLSKIEKEMQNLESAK